MWTIATHFLSFLISTTLTVAFWAKQHEPPRAKRNAVYHHKPRPANVLRRIVSANWRLTQIRIGHLVENRPWPWPTALKVDRTGKMMVYIPKGRFLMGSKKGDADERPLNWVTLTTGFWMDQTEVTGDEYQACVDAKKCRWKYRTHFVWPNAPYTHQEKRELATKYCKGYRAHHRTGHPVNCINWFLAEHFCRVWRKGRLANEAEWEFAARGGKHHKTYVWGEGPIKNRGLFDQPIGPGFVAQYPPNGYGLHDMVGNVWEWVNDWYNWNTYGRKIRIDPRGPCAGKKTSCGALTDRVMRGGSWYEDGSGLRVAYRNRHGPQYTYRVVGFRCAGNK